MKTTYPHWIYDGSPIDDPFGYGERAVKFLRLLKHPKVRARSKGFRLDPWQERIIRRIYGPCDPDGRRIVRNVVWLLPRGNRKTSLAAALALLHTIGPEREPGGEAIFAASDRKQAGLGFREATGIIRADKRLASAVRINDSHNAAKRIIYKKDGTVLETISADAGTQHGRTPSFVLADELHAWKNRDLWDVLRTALAKISGTLLIVATTAGRGQENIAHDIVDYARKVARGEIDDPATLPILFEADRNCDWRDEAIWDHVNPGLKHGYPDIEGLRQLAREAENRPGDREAFRQLHLNIWLDHSADPFVDMDIYDEGETSIDLEALADRPCWIAVDMGLNEDLTAVVAAWRNDDGGYIVMAWFFCPGDNLKGRSDRDNVPYVRWHEEGHIIATPGNVTDYETVTAHIRDLCNRFDVREIVFDPAYAQAVMMPLTGDGLPTATMRQGWVTMGPAIKELERAIIGRKFHHNGHPILRWNFDNVAIKSDEAGNKSFNKGKSKDRIDGAVAAAMAVARAAAGNDDEGLSAYSDKHFNPSLHVW